MLNWLNFNSMNKWVYFLSHFISKKHSLINNWSCHLVEPKQQVEHTLKEHCKDTNTNSYQTSEWSNKIFQYNLTAVRRTFQYLEVINWSFAISVTQVASLSPYQLERECQNYHFPIQRSLSPPHTVCITIIKIPNSSTTPNLSQNSVTAWN